ncbi:MAG: hypothetical protein DMF85_11245 [Acidobacteria bacterium]|nr:MAG: hypothetical protein DMF85_11245 [Acidobacteriota bacterium]
MTTYSAKATPLVCALIVLAPIAAAAQSPAQPGAGPMQIEQMENGFVVAPDLKATRVSGTTRGLAGAYAGFLMDNTLLLGGAAYWLPDGPDGMRMAYGGAIVGWQMRADERLGFAIRTLVGGGRTSTRFDGGVIFTGRGVDDRRGTHVRPDGRGRFRLYQEFFTVEPQADVLIRLTRRFRIDAGAGYRAIAAAHGSERDLRGATATLALQFSTADR